MSVVCRPARAQDLEFADTLVVSSINHLTERHGFGTMAIPSPPKFQSFSLNDDADGLWVAEEDDRILGFAWSWVCGDMWFLAQLFVSPDQQEYRQRVDQTDPGTRREIGRFQQGPYHLQLQHRFARP